MELLEVLELLSHADVLDRRPGHPVDREGGAASRIAVHLGENHPGDAHRLVKTLRDPDGILAGHPVGHEENLMRVHRGLEPGELPHHLLVDLQAAGEDYNDEYVGRIAAEEKK